MLHLEFAVSPEQIRSVADLSLLEARLGFDKGAFLSRFPKQWFREVSERLESNLQPGQLDRATERLRQIQRSRLVAFGRPYEGVDWANAARYSHAIVPFHRAVDNTFNELPTLVTSINELDDADFIFETQFPRDASSLAQAGKALLIDAEKVILHDNFICLTKAGYKKTLLEMMRFCTKAEVEFHFFSEEDGKSDWGLRKQALIEFSGRMPVNIRLFWYRSDDGGSGFLHQRGMFTAKGGLIYDRGFEEPNDHAQRATLTPISPMPAGMLVSNAKSYNTAQQSDDFKLVGQIWRSHD
tara:strand:- start:42326 stop:43216 length:891 start_codon:yes stop_codon:yes gene_type:complete